MKNEIKKFKKAALLPLHVFGPHAPTSLCPPARMEGIVVVVVFCSFQPLYSEGHSAVLPLFIDERRHSGWFAESVNSAATVTICFLGGFFPGELSCGRRFPLVHTPTASSSHPISFKHLDQCSPSSNTYSLPANRLMWLSFFSTALFQHYISEILSRPGVTGAVSAGTR